MEIPRQLHQLRLIRIRHKQKIPIDPGWNKDKNYSYDDPVLQKHLADGGNYGVACGFNYLLVIDYDSIPLYEKKQPLLPPTYCVKTGSDKYHAYYFVDDAKSWKITDADGTTLCDVQGTGKQVVGPGSTHPSGNKYVSLNDLPIATVKSIDIKKVFADVNAPLKTVKPLNAANTDPIRDEIKRKWRVSDQLSEYGSSCGGGKGNTACPLHEDTTGRCLSYDDTLNGGVWHCFDCEKSGDVFSLVREKNNMDFVEAKHFLAQKLNLSIKYNFKKASKAFSEDFLEMADNFLDVQPLYYDNSRIWWAWKNDLMCWQMLDETDIMNLVDTNQMTDNTYHSVVQGNIIRSLQRRARIRSPKIPGYLHIQFKDCIVNVQDHLLLCASPDLFTTNPVPWEMGKSEDTPTMDKLFEEWVGKEHVQTLYEIVAFCCVPDYFLQRIFVMVGNGSNGKSTFMRILRKFLGEENCSASELEDLSKNRFESSKLFKKLCCQMGETNFGRLENTKRLKMLSGNDAISFEFKGKDPFVANNYAKIVISTNTLPITFDTTDGFYRRWVIIDFPNQFSEQKDVFGSIPDDEYRNLALKVKRLAHELWVRRSFTNEGDISQRKARYEERSNPLHQFLKEETVDDPNGYIPKWQLREGFTAFLAKKGLRVWSDPEISRTLRDKGVEDTQKSTVDCPGWRVWLGIRWKDEVVFGNKKFGVPNSPNTFTTPFQLGKYSTIQPGVKPPLKVLGCEDLDHKRILNELFSLFKIKNTRFLWFDDDILPHFRHYCVAGNHPETECLKMLTTVMMQAMSRGDLAEEMPGKYFIVE